MILLDGVRYKLWTPQDEVKEFHPIIKANSKEIFGKDSIFFDVKQKLASGSIAAIPDAYVVTLSKPPKWYVVEIELASHDPYSHIVNQLSKFISGLKEPNSRKDIRNILLASIKSDRALRTLVDEYTGDEPHLFLTELTESNPELVVVIEEATDAVKKACEALQPRPRILEFKVFRRENAESVHAYLFEPLESKVQEKKPDRVKPRRGVPAHYESWEKMLEWVDPTTKVLAHSLINSIREKFRNTVEGPSGRYYRFDKGRRGSNSRFAALILRRNAIKVRVRADPKTFVDPQNWTKGKVYKGWFFSGTGEEREFQIDSAEQIPYAMQLIAQSYVLAE